MPVFLRVFLTTDKLVSVTEPGLAACHLKKNQYWQKLVERKAAFNQNADNLGGWGWEDSGLSVWP